MPWDSTPRILPALMVTGGCARFGGQVWPGRINGTLSPAWKFCAPQTMSRSPRPSLTRHNGEFVGIGMFVAREHLRDDNAVKFPAELLHALDFQAEHGQARGQFLRRPIEMDVLPEPIKSDLHRASGPAFNAARHQDGSMVP
jgi:hypothetical protein